MLEQIPLKAPINDENRFYMQTKVEKMGHDFDIETKSSKEPMP
jgi:GTP cyclohydrolase II